MEFLVFGVNDEEFLARPFFTKLCSSSLPGVLAVGLFADDTNIGSTSGRVGLLKGKLIQLKRSELIFLCFAFITTHHNY